MPAVTAGLEADVVTEAMACATDALHEKGRLIAVDWLQSRAHNASACTFPGCRGAWP